MSDIGYEYFGDDLCCFVNIDYGYIHNLITYDRELSKDISVEDANKIIRELFEGKYNLTKKIDNAIESEFKEIIKRKEVKDA